jgi:hypothetical protein
VAIIADARRIVWQGNVGVDGDIPARTTIFCTVTDPPYNADPIGITDASSAIQAAITACTVGQVVYIPAGTYKIGTRLNIKTGITVRGAGKALTKLKGASGSSITSIIQFGNPTWSNYYETARDITGGATKDSTSLSVTTTDWNADDLILIDQQENTAGDPTINHTGYGGVCTWAGRESGVRCFGQLAQVSSVSVGTLNIKIPIYYTYDPAKTPQASRVLPSNIIYNAGVEDLTVDNTLSWSSAQQYYGTIVMPFVWNCWLLNVDVDMVYRVGIALEIAYRCTIRGCRVFESYDYEHDAGYGIWFEESTSANLVENNKMDTLCLGPMMIGVCSGNVVSYNYVTSLIYTPDARYIRPGIIMHGAHPFMNLFEGNYLLGPNFEADNNWGSSSHNTLLRNSIIMDPTKTMALCDVQVDKMHQYYNLVGNVLGNGTETTYENANVMSGNNIYSIDWDYLGSPDGKSAATILRHGNYDTKTPGVVWDAGIGDHVIPNSYYLTGKPSWWGSGVWPSIGSDLSPMNSGNPASGFTGTYYIMVMG